MPCLLLFTSSPVIQVIHSIPGLKFISLAIHRSWDPRYPAGLVVDPRPPLEKVDPKHVQWLSGEKSTSVAGKLESTHQPMRLYNLSSSHTLLWQIRYEPSLPVKVYSATRKNEVRS